MTGILQKTKPVKGRQSSKAKVPVELEDSLVKPQLAGFPL
jgi:hypothetical protein